MKNFIDFNNVEILDTVFYGGDAGAKFAIQFEGEVWMLKLPKSTREYAKPQVSYTTSPLNEYIGSKIYESLGISVHETILGQYANKVVVACKDFTYLADENIARLIPFNELKNAYMSSDLDSYSGTGSETLLNEVLDTIAGQKTLKNTDGAMKRFWDMFIVDAFIGNNDRNNGNWGLLLDLKTKQMTLAPVFDNGNAFFNKRSIEQMMKRMDDLETLREDAYRVPTSAFKYIGASEKAHKINPFHMMDAGGDSSDVGVFNPDINVRSLFDDAILRFSEQIDMRKITKIISGIPEKVESLIVMPANQKAFYLKTMQIRLDEVILPAAQKIKVQREDKAAAKGGH